MREERRGVLRKEKEKETNAKLLFLNSWKTSESGRKEEKGDVDTLSFLRNPFLNWTMSLFASSSPV